MEKLFTYPLFTVVFAIKTVDTTGAPVRVLLVSTIIAGTIHGRNCYICKSCGSVFPDPHQWAGKE